LLFMNTNFDKPFKTYDEQIEIIKSRNIKIEDPVFARNVLSSISYYTIINGYKNSFLLSQETESFVDGTSFEDLYTLHWLDTSLSNLLFKYILYIEQSLKTRISYLVSSNYGVFTPVENIFDSIECDYLSEQHYTNRRGKRRSVLQKLKISITSERNNESVNHYLHTKNHIPPWIMITNIPFGLAIEWYGILKEDDKTNICNQFIYPNPSASQLLSQDVKEFFRKALMLLREYRNKIAHGHRIFTVNSSIELPKRPLFTLCDSAVSSSEYTHEMGKNDLYAILLSLYVLINDRYYLSNFISELHSLLDPYKNKTINGKTVFEIFSFPENLFERLESLIADKLYNLLIQ